VHRLRACAELGLQRRNRSELFVGVAEHKRVTVLERRTQARLEHFSQRIRIDCFDLDDMAPERVDHRARCAALDDLAGVDERDFVAAVGFLQVVRGEQHRHAGAGAQALDEAPDLASVGQVEPDGRLVEKQDPRVVDDAAHDIERAPHAAGKRADRALPLIVQAEQLEQLAAALLDERRLEVVQQAREAQILCDRQRAIECRILEHEPDGGPYGDWLGADVIAGDRGAARAGTDQRGQHVNGGGLARAVRTEQAEESAGRDFELEGVYREDVAEAFGQRLRVDGRLQSLRPDIVHGLILR
jgi:hypothetical protein